ncbi:hypothetical protein GGR54DRAFT_197514 [Hypoxylon sp. NC1633]|nr:hypothetical protein GGR54DRAFT_197514 [Hypoxylon sp. NC1633]
MAASQKPRKKTGPPRSQLFAGKLAQIQEQHTQFLNDQSSQRDGQNQTPFTNYSGPFLDESPTAWLIGNRASFDVGQYKEDSKKAGMSMVHLLAISKAPIYNAVALDRGNVSIIDEMIAMFREAWARPEIRMFVRHHQLERIREQAKVERNPSAFGAAMKHYRELERLIDGLTFDDFAFGFHLYPDHSINHLHMHIIANTLKCRQYSTTAHDSKTKDALEVRDFILSLPELPKPEPEPEPESERPETES